MSSASAISPTAALVDLSALAHNLNQVRGSLPPGCDVLAVVKADAYGHGAIPVAKELSGLNVSRFGVASVAEGRALRQAGIRRQILVMGPLFADQLPDIVAHNLTPVLADQALVEPLVQIARPHAIPYVVHIKVDTGMGRLGFSPGEIPDLLESPAFKGPLRAEGLMTHLADADNEDDSFTCEQVASLHAILTRLQSAGLAIPIIHAANSAGVIAHPTTHLTLVRPGLVLYGYAPSPRLSGMIQLIPVLTLRTRVAQIRTLQPGQSVSYGRTYRASIETRVAILPFGYADGYSRAFSNRGAVLIRGCRAPVVGRVCMDMTIVDVTRISGVQVGDPVIVIGTQGTERITAADLAEWIDTIPYEILCAIGPRVPRIYTHTPQEPDPTELPGGS